MIPWELMGSSEIPGNGGNIRLYRRGKEFSIRVDRQELMNSKTHGSEEALATLACAKISGHSSPVVLIGGLGMGFTVEAALRQLGPDGRVVVAELVPAVVQWNRGPLAELANRPLYDGRVTVHETDVAILIQTGQETYDAILLDVDNGPEGLTSKDNNRLYSTAGLKSAFAALKPAGVLAVWSAAPDQAFTKRLTKTGFKVEEVHVRARGRSGGGHHTIWVAVR